MNRRNFLRLALAGGASLVLAACDMSGQETAVSEDIADIAVTAPEAAPRRADRAEATLVLDWVPNTNHTGLYAARALGYFEEENLDFKIEEPVEVDATSVVAAGNAEFGIGFQEFLTPALVQGAPVVSVAAIIQENTSGFASLKSRGISRPREFEGAIYGGFGSPLELAILQVMMEQDGGDFSQLESVGAGAADFLTIIQRDVDLYWIFYAWQGVKADLEGIELNVAFLSDWGVPNYYTPLIMANAGMLGRRREIGERAMAAISRGYDFAIANPAEAAEMLIQASPEIDVPLAHASQLWLSPRYQGDADRWGRQQGSVWADMTRWMLERELIEEMFEWENAFSNELLPE